MNMSALFVVSLAIGTMVVAYQLAGWLRRS